MSETLKSALQKNAHRTSTRRPGQRLTAKETKEKQETFLKTFANTGNVRAACMQADIDRSTVHRWNEVDEHFSMQYNIAKEDVNDMIRAEIMRRAVHGEERYVTSMGKVVYHNEKPLTIKEKSDVLLMFHAKSRMPEYRDKSATVNIITPKEYINVPDDDGVEEHEQ